jgi:hypothetical protein
MVTVSVRGIGRNLGVSRGSAAKIARSGALRSVLLPGLKRRRYLLDDVLRLAKAGRGDDGQGPPRVAVATSPSQGGDES